MAQKNQSKASYLQSLKFDKKLENSFFAKYLTNFRYVFLLIIFIVFAGSISYINLPRRLNPEVKIPIVSVSTLLPGAGPEDIESLITIPIEDELSGIANVNTISSTSQENVSAISVEFNSGTDPDKAKDVVQSAVDAVSGLPTDAKAPRVQKLDFESQPVWQFLLTGSTDEASLLRFAENLKDKIEKLQSVKSVTVSGLDEEEIEVLVRPEAASTYNINPFTLSQAVKASTSAFPSGSVNTQNSSFTLTIDPTVTSANDLRNLRLNIAGTNVALSDVATVQKISKPNQPSAYLISGRHEPQRAISFSVLKAENANIDKAVNDVRKATDKMIKNTNDQFEIKNILDLSEQISKQFNDLLGSFRDTIILVFLTLFFFLGVRQAAIVALSIPLSFLVTFTVMNITGLSINFLSLFSLILALGLLVDDAIVVATAVTSYWRSGKFTPNQTGLLVIRDFIVPIWSTTITAVWAFLPLLIASGIIGEFIKSIPIVVSATLLASTAIAVLITLPTMMVLLKPDFPKRVVIFVRLILLAGLVAFLTLIFINNPFFPAIAPALVIFFLVTYRIRYTLNSFINSRFRNFISARTLKSKGKEYLTHGIFDSQKFSRRYQHLIERVLKSKSARRKTLIIIALFTIFSYVLVPLGFVVNEFFPKENSDILYVQLEMPSGTNLKNTTTEALTISNIIKKNENLDFLTMEPGKTINFQSFFDTAGNGSKSLITLNLKSKNKRSKTSGQIAQELRDQFQDYSKGKIQIIEISGGPPAGSDIQIKLAGQDRAILDKYADKLIDFLNAQPGTINVNKTIESGTSKIVFTPNIAKMAQYSITQDQIGFALRTFASGFTLDNVKFNEKSIDINFRNSKNVPNPEELTKITISTPQGNVPVNSLGSFQLLPNPTSITREDGKRTLSVSSAITTGFSISQTNKKLEDFAKTLDLPDGYSWQTGGVNEENQKSVNSIFQAMIIAFILIFTTMVLQFGSYRKAFIILLLIPLAVSGVFVVFGLTGTPLSFPTLIGILALFGIVVYQAMMIVDKIDRNRRTGMNITNSISDAAASRVEPILFGTITTVMGLIPISISDPLWRGLGGAIIAGMLFSGIIMLLFIPIVYFMIYQNEK